MLNKNSEKYFLIIVTLSLVSLSFFILKEILSILIYAALLSYLLNPLYKFFQTKIENKNLCSILTIVVSIIGFIIPSFFLGYFFLLEGIKTTLNYQKYLENPTLLEDTISIFLSNFFGTTIEIPSFQNFILQIFSYFINLFQNIMINLPKIFFLTFVVFFVVYYILLYKEKIKKFISETIPLSIKKQKEVKNRLTNDMKVLFRGYFLTSLVQTIVSVIGYLIFDVENILIVTILTFILSILPYIGPALVWILLSFYFILSSDYINGFGLALYGIFIISSVDNFLRPYLMSSKDFLSPPFVFIGIIGGILIFGVSGIIIGPLVFSITTLFLKYMKEHYGI